MNSVNVNITIKSKKTGKAGGVLLLAPQKGIFMNRLKAITLIFGENKQI